MDKPKITEEINGYLLEWEQPNLTARVTRLRIPSDGQVKGELQIKHEDGNGNKILLVPTQFNFSAEPTRAKYAKQLAEKLDIQVDWKEVFDYLCNEIQLLARTGETVIEVWTENDEPAPEHWLDGIIYKGVQNIIYGEKGVMKSTLSYTLGICVMLPWTDNPFHLTLPERPEIPLILDWETDSNIFKRTIARLKRGMDMPNCPLYYRRCVAPLADDIEPIQELVESCKATVLIVDSLGAAAGGERGELKGAESAIVFNSSLRKLRTHTGEPITSLIIAQTRKGDEDRKKTIYGSTYFAYYARNIFELCKGTEDYDNEEHMALFNRFCNLGRRIKPIGFCATFDDETGGINLTREVVSVSEFSEKVTIGSRILELLKEGKMKQKDIKDSLGTPYSSTSMALKRLQQQGKVVRINDYWGLLNE